MAFLEFKHVSKHFGGVHALRGIDFSVEAGEVRGLVGENGSGKSTTMRILAGIIAPDTGQVLVNGKELPSLDPTARLNAGVGVVFQEPHLCPDLTVAENLFLGRLPRSAGFVHWLGVNQRSTEVLSKANLPLSSRAVVQTLSQDEQHMTEVARVLAWNCHVIAFDETTASLTSNHVNRLFRIISQQRKAGAAIIFISHRLEEVFEICDTVTVLRDGEVRGTVETASSNEDEVINLMVGRSLASQFFRPAAPKGDVALEVHNMKAGGLRQGINFDLHAGEVIGIGGLVGSGRSTVLEAIYGLLPRQGNVIRAGKRIHPHNPHSAIEAGIGFVPEDRRSQGLALEMSVKANAMMVLTGSRPLTSLSPHQRENSIMRILYDQLKLKAADASLPVRTLSGGNQQKIVLGRWLEHRPAVLLLDEPTRGIDIGAKQEIYDLIHSLAKAGLAILLVSSELPELMGLCDRIIVLREGVITGEFERGVTEEELATAMAGSNIPSYAISVDRQGMDGHELT